MNSSSVEIFIEEKCTACDEVLDVVGSLSTQHRFNLHVYDRRRHKSAFDDRSVFICPATFVNNRLAFYGSFSAEEFSRYLHLNESILTKKGDYHNE